MALVAMGWAKFNEPAVQQSLRLMTVAAGFAAAKQLLEEYGTRLVALEERGLVPLDDMATVGDLAKIDRRVWVLEGEPGPDPAAAILPPQPDHPERLEELRDELGIQPPEPEPAEEAAPPAPDL
jgi:hypothetical protein